MNKAILVKVADKANPISKPGPLMGKSVPYWTKDGITIFFDEDDWIPQDDDVVTTDALPGMVGVNWRGTQLWTILKDGTPYMLCELEDGFSRTIMNAIDQRAGEIREEASH